MPDETSNLVLEQLRLLRNELADFRRESKQRFTSLEIRLAGVENNMAAVHADMAHIHGRLDRIEQRLDLVDNESESH